jgi:hypothetical protein
MRRTELEMNLKDREVLQLRSKKSSPQRSSPTYQSDIRAEVFPLYTPEG